MVNIMDLFRKSPFEPLTEHMLRVKSCIELIKPLFMAVVKDNHEEVQHIAKQISKREHNADIVKNEIRRTLPKQLFLPAGREDILRYLKLQDDIADSIEDIAVLLTLKEITVPDNLKDKILEYVDKVIEVCNITDEATDHLKKLVEVGFGGPESEIVLDLIEKAEYAEWESDNLEVELARLLFKLENEVSAVDIFLWFRIFGELGKLANAAEKTGDAFRLLVSPRK